MFKPNNKKMLTVLITLAMVFSALAVISMAAQPAYAATITSPTYDPTIFSVGVATVTAVSGGSGFTSGGVVDFYLGTSTTFSSSDPLIGIARLPAGTTSFASPGQAVTLTIPSGTPAGTYYIFSEDVATSAFAVSTSVTVTTFTPTIALSATTQTAGGSILLTGSGWDPSSTLALTLIIPGGTALTPATVTVSGAGAIPAKTYITVPTNEPYGIYEVIAQEISSGSPNVGITADASFTLEPAVGTGTSPSPSPGALISITGALSSTFYIGGYGFPAGATISSSTPGTVTVGGVNAVLASSETVASNGEVSLLVTSLASKITTSGPQTIVITTSMGTFSFSAAIYVSVPGVSTTLSVIDLYTGINSGVSTDPMEIVGYGFAASSSVTVTFDGSTFSGTTDANGFFIITGTSVTVPSLPAGTYNVFATAGGLTASTTFTIAASPLILDSAGHSLNNEYAARGSVVTVYLTGYAPYQAFDVTDSGLKSAHSYTGGSLAVYNYYTSSVTITVGSFNPTVPEFVANGAGILELSYSIVYNPHLATGTPETVTVVSPPGGTSIASATYDTIGMATTTPATSYAPSATVSLTFSGLVPYGASATPESAPYLSPYSTYIEATSSTSSPYFYATANLVKLTNTKTTFDSSASGTAIVSFVLPITSPSVNTITVYGESTSSGKSTSSAAVYSNNELIVSVAGSSSSTVYVNPAVTSVVGGSGTSGSPYTMYPDPNAYIYDIEYDFYDLPASTPVTLTYYTSSGVVTSKSAFTTDANGAGTYTFAPPYSAGGIPYLLEFSVTGVDIRGGAATGTVTGAAAYFYELIPAVAYDVTPFLDNLGMPATDYYSYYGSNASAGTSVTVYGNSLLPDTYYNIYFDTSTALNASNIIKTVETNATGDLHTGSSPGVTLTIPYTATTGTYYLDFAPASSSATSTSLYLTVEVNQIIPAYAFPGEAVPISIVLSSAPSSNVVYYDVQVMENGSMFQSLQVPFTTGGQTPPSYYLNFSFNMPNAEPGNYFTMSFQYEPVFTGTVVGSAGSSATVTGIGPSATYTLPYKTTLVSGSGALVVSISTSQIATIITKTINSAMSVPLSELDASIASLNGTVVTLKTAFGTMQTTLKTINATVASISSGMALLQTELGAVKVSLSSLNATIMSLNGTVATLSTTLGEVQTSLSAINATVTSNGNGIATIKTSLGQISGTITSENGNIATIQTSLGTIQANVSKVVTNTQGFPTIEIFEIVILVLVLITLVVAFMAVNNSNRVAKKIEEQKKQ